MNSRFLSVLAAATLVLGGAAWSAASSSHSVGVTLAEATTVSGTVLPAGHYRFSWMGDSNQVNVVVKNEDDNVVAKTQAKLEQRSQRAPSQEVITRTAKSGGHVLEQVRLGGRKTALVFTTAAS
jgi:tetraacyldisaccharide-1-P 4'-kinase